MSMFPNESQRLLRLESDFEIRSRQEYRAFTCFLVAVLCFLFGLIIILIYAPIKAKNAEAIQLTGLELLNSLYDDRVPLHSGCESTVLILRHCEKDEDGVVHRNGKNYCSWLGRERAYFLPSLFDPDNLHRRWPIPYKIFALTEQRDGRQQYGEDGRPNYREIETVMPLAHAFGLPIEVYPFDTKVLASDVFELLQSGDACGHAFVVSWKHELIPQLAKDLGCHDCPSSYPDDTFDQVWQIKYVFDPEGRASSSPDPMDLPVSLLGPLSLYEPKILPVNALDDDDDDDDDQTAPVSTRPTKVPNPTRAPIIHRHKRRPATASPTVDTRTTPPPAETPLLNTTNATSMPLITTTIATSTIPNTTTSSISPESSIISETASPTVLSTTDTTTTSTVEQSTDTAPPTNEEENNPLLRRVLRQKQKHKHKHKHKHRSSEPKTWVLYSSVTYQYFDPLDFSLKSGDYPREGSHYGGHWADEM